MTTNMLSSKSRMVTRPFYTVPPSLLLETIRSPAKLWKQSRRTESIIHVLSLLAAIILLFSLSCARFTLPTVKSLLYTLILISILGSLKFSAVHLLIKLLSITALTSTGPVKRASSKMDHQLQVSFVPNHHRPSGFPPNFRLRNS